MAGEVISDAQKKKNREEKKKQWKQEEIECEWTRECEELHATAERKKGEGSCSDGRQREPAKFSQ